MTATKEQIGELRKFNWVTQQKKIVEYCAKNKIDCELTQTENGIFTAETYRIMKGVQK